MAKAKRVFELAKELGVKSKAIVEKCQAEDVPGITNHMSTVKMGLEMTIREWFSEEDTASEHTAVETSDRVDLSKVRAPRRKAKRAKAQDESASDQATATATIEEEQPKQAGRASDGEKEATIEAQEPAQAAEATDTSVLAEQPTDQGVAEPPAEATATEAEESAEQASPQAEQAQATGEQAGEGQDDQSQAVKPAGQLNVPKRPEVVKPVGEQLAKPQQARLKGPKVVRIEKPEPERPVRKRPSPPQAFDGDQGGSAAGSNVPGISRARGPARGRGAGGGMGEREESGRGGKRRRLNTRRGRSADALPTGPAKFSKADMEELDNRLKGASGYLKQRRRDMRKREKSGGQQAQSAAVTGGRVEIQEPITIKALSAATGIRSGEIIKWLFKQGVMANINSAIDTEAAMEVAMEYDIELDVKEQQTAEELIRREFEARQAMDIKPRPPVVTVLGHVDHGKTSLLDRIRTADVATHEAGGITQHVGAYRVTIKGTDEQAKTVVFLDTPGHEAFTSMRSRGAKMTDLVVLVVAADDGVMPQTIESINHAKAAEVPMIVALNKIDTPQATDDNIHKIYGQLAEHGLNPVEWGGETEIVKTSATQGTGVTELVEILDYQAELLELTADYGGPARGTVIEAEMQPGRGPVARVLVQQGQIKVGDFIVIGRSFGRVRDMTDDRRQNVEQAGPATPLELSGIDEVPDAGDKFYVTDTLKKAEEIANQYRDRERHQQLASKTKVTLENFADQIKAGQTKELRVVLKADVQGSMDVLRSSLEEMGNEEVTVRVLHAAVGGITENDVVLADASDAIIVGFHVAATPAVRDIADERKVQLRLYRVIYDLTDDVKKALEGMLEPETRETEIGSAEVREVFKISKVGSVAGCLVSEGSIQRSGKARVVRDGVVVTDHRQIESLRRVKEDVREVRAGTECGIRLIGFDDIKVGDTIVCYDTEQVKRTLD